MSGAGASEAYQWTYSLRVIPDVLDRARWRNVLTYQVHPKFSLGIEYNPLASDVHPVANWTIWTETEHRPALILGTSSDRIGTPHGTAVFATFSKDLEPYIGLPIAPYLGVSYGTYDSELVPIGGLNIRLPKDITASVLFDGHKLHPMISWSHGRHQIGFMLAFGKEPGVFYSIRF